MTIAILAFLFCQLAFYHFKLIHCPVPLEYRESAVVMQTRLMLTGENPYDIAHQPLYANAYGFGYYSIVYPFARLFGPGFVVHRAVSGFFVIATNQP